MNFIKGLGRRILGLIRKQRSMKQVSHLIEDSTGVNRALWEAVMDTLTNRWDTDGRWWMEEIELLRKRLNSSDEIIEIVDYGAGDPKMALTEDEMYKGNLQTKTLGEISSVGSKPPFWCRILFNLIRRFKPSRCLELGTCVGISASYQAAALRLNGAGQIITLEGSPSLATLSRKNFSDLGLDNATVVTGRFQDVLPGILDQNHPIDYAFIDGHHSEAGTLGYFKQILPFLSDHAMLVFDDISWSEGMKRAWKTIESDDAISQSANLFQLGICTIEKEAVGGKKHIYLRLL